jgi:hypothetical protein
VKWHKNLRPLAQTEVCSINSKNPVWLQVATYKSSAEVNSKNTHRIQPRVRHFTATEAAFYRLPENITHKLGYDLEVSIFSNVTNSTMSVLKNERSGFWDHRAVCVCRCVSSLKLWKNLINVHETCYDTQISNVNMADVRIWCGSNVKSCLLDSKAMYGNTSLKTIQHDFSTM